jgi:hypothetical protein
LFLISRNTQKQQIGSVGDKGYDARAFALGGGSLDHAGCGGLAKLWFQAAIGDDHGHT